MIIRHFGFIMFGRSGLAGSDTDGSVLLNSNNIIINNINCSNSNTSVIIICVLMAIPQATSTDYSTSAVCSHIELGQAAKSLATLATDQRLNNTKNCSAHTHTRASRRRPLTLGYFDRKKRSLS